MNRFASLSVPGEAGASGYSTRDVAALLGIPVAMVRSYVRSGFLTPGQGPRGEYRFTFQDLILMRTAKGLVEARVPQRRIVLALRNLREQLPEGQPITGVRISAEGHHVVVRDGLEVWNPESGQALLDFEVSDLAREAASLDSQRARRFAAVVVAEVIESDEPEADSADEWFDRGVELEADDPASAEDAYRQALEIDPTMVDARLNLGRLLHETGRTVEAEGHYRSALETRPDDTTALFNLGVALQDLGRPAEAAEIYEKALEIDPALADAHYNLAVVYEGLGRKKAAIRHLKSYKLLRG
ncbi:MAG TPA: tetratricopeptide repeat protein [Thermoanaerobaculia bacterium]|nr:tetratricopeptide repeat protein [Thermoanaerobaculia bacterium]